MQLVKVILSWSTYCESLNSNKKAFQSNADRPLSKRLCFVVKSLNMSGGGCCWGPVQKGAGAGAGGQDWDTVREEGPGKSLNRQINTTENITFLQLRWRAIINLTNASALCNYCAFPDTMYSILLQRHRPTILTRMHSVECKPPACREYGLHKIRRDVDILLWPWCDIHLDVWPWPH